jgi:hypothetical protein
MSWQPTRDLVGYGPTPPDPQWPGGARLALNFVMNYGEGSELSIDDGDGYTESGLTEERASIRCAIAAISAPRACSNTAAAWASGACCAPSASAICR